MFGPGVDQRARFMARHLLSVGVVQRRRQRARGFTLVELMAVVCIIGVLATLAVYGVKKYVDSAKTSEPMEIINSIRAAEESFKDETFAYKNVSDMSSYWPFSGVAALKNAKLSWDSGTDPTAKAAWAVLGVSPSTAVQFGYACAAGQGGGVPTQTQARRRAEPRLSGDGAELVRGARAAGDRDGNGILATFVGSNFTDAIYGENDTE